MQVMIPYGLSLHAIAISSQNFSEGQIEAKHHGSASGGFSWLVTSHLAYSPILSGRKFLCTTAMEYNPRDIVILFQQEKLQSPSDLISKFIRFTYLAADRFKVIFENFTI